MSSVYVCVVVGSRIQTLRSGHYLHRGPTHHTLFLSFLTATCHHHFFYLFIFYLKTKPIIIYFFIFLNLLLSPFFFYSSFSVGLIADLLLFLEEIL